jgi:hypothetical protein
MILCSISPMISAELKVHQNTCLSPFRILVHNVQRPAALLKAKRDGSTNESIKAQ